jgi:hypothetical protein
VGNNAASLVGNRRWFGPLRGLQRAFFHTPLVYLFIAGSDLYHDKIWWTVKGRGRHKRWRRTSVWGKLWERY